MKDCSVN